jgi:hypothetical protein
MNAPKMTDEQAGERQALHAAIGTFLANLTGAPDERRHLNDVLGLLSDRLNEASTLTQLRLLQLQTEIMQQEIAALQKTSHSAN